jgi:ribonuclease HI
MKKIKKNVKKEINKMNEKNETIEYRNIYTDGSIYIKDKIKIGGIGIYFEDEKNENISKEIINDNIQDILKIELLAIKEVFKIVDEKDNIIIHTDSLTSINLINDDIFTIKNIDLILDIRNIIKFRIGKTLLNKVLSHSGIFIFFIYYFKGKKDGNYYADKLAKDIIDKKLFENN